MDQHPRDYRGYGARPPDPRWPNGARLAVQIVMNYEEGSEYAIGDGDATSEMYLTEVPGATLGPGTRDLIVESTYEYGSRAGFWRLMRIFEHRGIPITVFGAALALERNPDAAAAIRAAGFEVCSHGWRWVNFAHMSEAEEREQMQRAIALGAEDFAPYFALGSLELRNMGVSDDDTHDARKNLERAAELNPMFAPTFEALTQAYSRSADTQAKALAAAETAVKLDSESRSYRTNLAYTLLNNGRTAQARAVAEKLEATASSEDEKRSAQSVLEAIADEEEWQRAGITEGTRTEFGPPGGSAAAPPKTEGTNSGAGGRTVSHRQLGPPDWMAVEGSIAAVDCARSPELTLTVNLPRGPMEFHAKDFGAVSVSAQSAAAVPSLLSCKSWAGRNVKIWFRMAQGQGFLGEITRVYFY